MSPPPALISATIESTMDRTAFVDKSEVLDGIPRLCSIAAVSGSVGRWTHPTTAILEEADFLVVLV